jgi:hypothetical protein
MALSRYRVAVTVADKWENSCGPKGWLILASDGVGQLVCLQKLQYALCFAWEIRIEPAELMQSGRFLL